MGQDLCKCASFLPRFYTFLKSKDDAGLIQMYFISFYLVSFFTKSGKNWPESITKILLTNGVKQEGFLKKSFNLIKKAAG